MEIILGVLASGLIQLIKPYTRETWITLSVLALVSIVLASFHAWMVSVGMWESFVGIMTTAGATYAFLIRNIEKAFE